MSEELKPVAWALYYPHNPEHNEVEFAYTGREPLTEADKMAGWEATPLYSADRITALIAAGDRLAGFVDHYNECDWADRERCECGLTEALEAWTEARGDDQDDR